MSAEENKAIIRRVFDEILNQDNRSIIGPTAKLPSFGGTTTTLG